MSIHCSPTLIHTNTHSTTKVLLCKIVYDCSTRCKTLILGAWVIDFHSNSFKSKYWRDRFILVEGWEQSPLGPRLLKAVGRDFFSFSFWEFHSKKKVHPLQMQTLVVYVSAILQQYSNKALLISFLISSNTLCVLVAAEQDTAEVFEWCGACRPSSTLVKRRCSPVLC